LLLDNLHRKMYLIVGTIGADSGGISHPPIVVDDAQEHLFAEVPDMVRALAVGKLTTDQAKRAIIGYWLTVEAEPSVFADVAQMTEAISPGAPDQGIAKLTNLLKDPLERCQTPIYLGLRFPNRRGDLEWQVLKLTWPKGEQPLVCLSAEELARRLRRYEIAAARTTPFTETGFHRRNEGRASRATLRNARLSVIGCGAIGSEVADTLAKAGVGRITLVDNELLHPNNVVRHVLGLNASEFPKTFAMQMQMLVHNPFSLVDSQPIDIRTHDIKDYMADDAVGVSSLADDNIEAFLNEQAVINNKVIFYVRSLRGGKAGRIFRVIPGRDACKCCLALYAGADDPVFPAVPPDPALPTIVNECNNPIRPASAADLKLMAALASSILLDHLQGRSSEANHWVWTSEPLDGFSQPLPNGAIHGAFHGSFLPPHASCTVCAPEDPLAVTIEPEARDFIQNESGASGEIETGGVLVGKRTRGVGVVVTGASGPGPEATRSRCEFHRDVAHCQRFLEEAAEERGDAGLYVGEWHYHPHGPTHPSNQDIRSLSEIAEQPEYLTERPISLIVGPGGDIGCTVHPFNKRHYPVPLGDK
jgi:integrative and conjugative element protein (TIGR02256 family)